MTASLLAAILIGLSSSAHCVFMCGGLTAAFTSSVSAASSQKVLASDANTGKARDPGTRRRSTLICLFHLGRLLSYAFLGLLMGTLIHSFNFMTDITPWLRIFAGLLLVLMGLYVTNIWCGLGYLEKLMLPIWQPISRAVKPYIPFRCRRHALMVGAVWGWLPCGLIYSTLAWTAITAKSGFEAALLMLVMGLGTLPALLGLSLFGSVVGSIKRYKSSHLVSGAALGLFGLWTMALPIISMTSDPTEGHHNHNHQSAGTALFGKGYQTSAEKLAANARQPEFLEYKLHPIVCAQEQDQ